MRKTWGRVGAACLGLLLSGAPMAAGRKTCEVACEDDVKQCQAICKQHAGRGVARCQRACADQKEPCLEACEAPPPKPRESRGGVK